MEIKTLLIFLVSLLAGAFYGRMLVLPLFYEIPRVVIRIIRRQDTPRALVRPIMTFCLSFIGSGLLVGIFHKPDIFRELLESRWPSIFLVIGAALALVQSIRSRKSTSSSE